MWLVSIKRISATFGHAPISALMCVLTYSGPVYEVKKCTVPKVRFGLTLRGLRIKSTVQHFPKVCLWQASPFCDLCRSVSLQCCCSRVGPWWLYWAVLLQSTTCWDDVGHNRWTHQNALCCLVMWSQQGFIGTPYPLLSWGAMLVYIWYPKMRWVPIIQGEWLKIFPTENKTSTKTVWGNMAATCAIIHDRGSTNVDCKNAT